ncbi:putative DNA-directed RNA polymerase subunit Rpb1 [Cafeteria roenbergensis virus]|uniref:DNA-directed RNA polymerase subunit n=1 Tax=Cafeteria roenbergensis virus (strain BV-PW1) TaxID=693272 RepID=E3T5D9_CROVB|nr:putative DNA-directed RNA polymerase subunit Rpb1 [Cafeteria roenbergensis virus BV-PW1]ADO67402.1 putative DNA-directed RNA polymerase subunit Rpb1 [Cafeteria roenbergensis virus BV-PW1]
MDPDQYYTEDISRIKEIEFSILSNEETKRMSSVRKDPFGINLAKSYNKYEPQKGGLVDLRLGTSDPYLNCNTCGLNMENCPGHFGHHELPDYFFHFGFLNHLTTILQCTCLKCSNILIENVDEYYEKLKNKKGTHRLVEIKEKAKKASYCFNCGVPVPKIKKEVKDSGTIKIVLEQEIASDEIDEKTGITTSVKQKVVEELSPRQVYEILRNMKDTDVFLLGFNPSQSHPKDFILKNFPVPPVIIRPTSKIDMMTASTQEDSLTLKIADVINNSNRLKKQLNKDAIDREDISTAAYDSAANVQYNLAVYFDNESMNLPRSEFKTGGRPTKSISERLKGKLGRVRNNLMGKRQDYCARSVITGDPDVNIDEIGIPLAVAKNITFPEIVTPQNIDELSKLVLNGNKKYPGANFVVRKSMVNGKQITQKIDLRIRKKTIKLEYGNIVHRHLQDGDPILFNRQPSLHKPSMMGHKVQVAKTDGINTFRMNVSSTAPYGADFDGDEMNGFFPQSIQARTELELIANVKNQIVGAKNSNPIIGCVQDGVTGSYLISLDDVRLSGREAHWILSKAEKSDLYKIDKNKTYTGKEIYSMIIPDGINSFKKKGDKYTFQVKDGKLLVGVLDKSQVADKANSLTHFVYDKKGGEAARMFLDDTQRTVLNYLIYRGFTVGFGDCFIDKDTDKKLHDTVIKSVLDNQFDITSMENQGNVINYDTYEESLQSAMTAVGGNTFGMVEKNLDKNNNFYIMSLGAKAKGKGVNIGQIISCLGQQTTEGKRVLKKVNGRTLSHFSYNDDTAFARGFVGSSYLEGMKGHEYFFHSVSGREGMITIALKTSSTGYIQRKLIKALEDLRVTYDGTVRNSNGTLIEYNYGNTGIDQLVQSSNKIYTILYSNKDVETKLGMSEKELLKSKSDKKINEKYISMVKEIRDKIRRNSIDSVMNYKTIEDSFLLPVNLYRIVQDKSDDGRTVKFDLSYQYILDKIEEILTDNKTSLMSKQAKFQENDEMSSKTIFKLALLEYLSPKKCLFEYNLNKVHFDEIVSEVKIAFLKAIVNPGEMVGVITAQSIGEPVTQLNLDSKHSAGMAKGASKANSGVPRIEEILNYSKNIKTPMASLYLKEPNNDKLAFRITNYLNQIKIGDLIHKAEIYYYNDTNSNLDEILKNDNVENPFFFNNQRKNIDQFPWVFRLELNREILLDKDVVLLDIKTKLTLFYYNVIQDIKSMKKDQKEIWENIIGGAVLSNQDTSDSPTVHIRLGFNNFNFPMITKLLKIFLNEVYLKGVNGINSAFNSKDIMIDINDKTGEIDFKQDYDNVIITDRINLEEIRLIKGIDQERIYINDIALVYNTFGIEATRNILITELRRTFLGGGADFNYQHLVVLADLMCYTGEIISIDRHGTNKMELDPLARSSFERTMEHFVNASIYNQTDRIKATSSRIMTGRVIPGGTGSFELLLDTNKLANSEFLDDEYQGRVNFDAFKDNDLFKDLMENDDVNIDFLT